MNGKNAQLEMMRKTVHCKDTQPSTVADFTEWNGSRIRRKKLKVCGYINLYFIFKPKNFSDSSSLVNIEDAPISQLYKAGKSFVVD